MAGGTHGILKYHIGTFRAEVLCVGWRRLRLYDTCILSGIRICSVVIRQKCRLFGLSSVHLVEIGCVPKLHLTQLRGQA